MTSVALRILCLSLALASCAPRVAPTPEPRRYLSSFAGALQQVISLVDSLDAAGFVGYRIDTIDENTGLVLVSRRNPDPNDPVRYNLSIRLQRSGSQFVIISIRETRSDGQTPDFALSRHLYAQLDMRLIRG